MSTEEKLTEIASEGIATTGPAVDGGDKGTITTDCGEILAIDTEGAASEKQPTIMSKAHALNVVEYAISAEDRVKTLESSLENGNSNFDIQEEPLEVPISDDTKVDRCDEKFSKNCVDDQNMDNQELYKDTANGDSVEHGKRENLNSDEEHGKRTNLDLDEGRGKRENVDSNEEHGKRENVDLNEEHGRENLDSNEEHGKRENLDSNEERGKRENVDSNEEHGKRENLDSDEEHGKRENLDLDEEHGKRENLDSDEEHGKRENVDSNEEHGKRENVDSNEEHGKRENLDLDEEHGKRENLDSNEKHGKRENLDLDEEHEKREDLDSNEEHGKRENFDLHKEHGKRENLDSDEKHGKRENLNSNEEHGKTENLDSDEPVEYSANENKLEDNDVDMLDSSETGTDGSCSLSVEDRIEYSNSENDDSDVHMCSICHENAWKYKCPKCLIKTCSLPCVKEHKKQENCDGIRCKTSYVPLSRYNESHMLNDYRLLEEIARNCDNHERDAKNRAPTMTKWMTIQAKEARKIKINLKLSPYSFSQHRINSTFFNIRTREFFWHIQWHFPKHDLSLHQKKNQDSKTLNEIFTTFLNANLQDQSCLKNYSGDNDLVIFMKRVDLPANQEKYHKIDLNSTLKEILRGKTVVEYPKFIVVLAQDAEEYEKNISEEIIPFPPLEVGFENTQKRKFHRSRFNAKRGRYRNFRGRGRQNQSSAGRGHDVSRPSFSSYGSAESFP